MILHCDMDAFYASVEERDRPELVGQGSSFLRGEPASSKEWTAVYGETKEMAARRNPSNCAASAQ